MMGNRKFMDLMMEDEIHWQGRTISHPADVTCVRDYMQVRDLMVIFRLMVIKIKSCSRLFSPLSTRVTWMSYLRVWAGKTMGGGVYL